MKELSTKDETLTFLEANIDVMYYMAWPAGSMINGYLLNLFKIIAFYVHKSSAGSLCDLQINLSLGFERYYTSDKSARCLTS